MSAEFDPGDGWREATEAEARESLTQLAMRDDNVYRYWVPEEPVPPLPTEPNTVIRVTLKKDGRQARWILLEDGGWRWPDDHLVQFTEITGFEVLAEPHRDVGEYTQGAVDSMLRVQRRETAKAVVDRVIELGYDELAVDLDREFGVGA